MKTLFAFFAIVSLLCLALVRLGSPSSPGDGEPLTLYCAAGIRLAVEPAVRAFEQETGATVHIQYGGSGSLLGQLQVDGNAADLYLPGDEGYLDAARAERSNRLRPIRSSILLLTAAPRLEDGVALYCLRAPWAIERGPV